MPGNAAGKGATSSAQSIVPSQAWPAAATAVSGTACSDVAAGDLGWPELGIQEHARQAAPIDRAGTEARSAPLRRRSRNPPRP